MPLTTVRWSRHCLPRLPLPGGSGLMRSHTSSVSSPRPATAVCLPVIHTEQEKNLPAVAVIHQTGPSTGPVRGACDSLHFAVRRHSSEERGMPESEKRSFWNRLFNTADRSSEREARVLEYIMHRVGEGAPQQRRERGVRQAQRLPRGGGGDLRP